MPSYSGEVVYLPDPLGGVVSFIYRLPVIGFVVRNLVGYVFTWLTINTAVLLWNGASFVSTHLRVAVRSFWVATRAALAAYFIKVTGGLGGGVGGAVQAGMDNAAPQEAPVEGAGERRYKKLPVHRYGDYCEIEHITDSRYECEYKGTFEHVDCPYMTFCGRHVILIDDLFHDDA